MVQNFRIIKILTFVIFLFFVNFVSAEEEEIYLKAISDQIQVITKDLKTLEKAVYQKADVVSSKSTKSIKLTKNNRTHTENCWLRPHNFQRQSGLVKNYIKNH